MHGLLHSFMYLLVKTSFALSYGVINKIHIYDGWEFGPKIEILLHENNITEISNIFGIIGTV